VKKQNAKLWPTDPAITAFLDEAGRSIALKIYGQSDFERNKTRQGASSPDGVG
jgi:hypothetical protein